MILARFEPTPDEDTLVVSAGNGWVPVEGSARIADVVGRQQLDELATRIASLPAGHETVSVDLDRAGTIADRHADIWGAGLNYLGHSEDLDASQPSSGPGSYLRPTGCLIDNGEDIELPAQSSRVTAEAELGLVVGAECKNVDRADWRSVIAGATAVLDLTAEDAIRENPRYIPWAKGFDTFCSIGPTLVTLDELSDDDLESMQTSTIRNGETVASATPKTMKYDIGFLVQYFTAGRTIRPGTVICTGTPGAVVIRPGDVITATVDRVGSLTHGVR